MITSSNVEPFGCFDAELRVQSLLANGDPLTRFSMQVNWESFHALLGLAFFKSTEGSLSRSAQDSTKLFKLLGASSALVPRKRSMDVESATIRVRPLPETQTDVGFFQISISNKSSDRRFRRLRPRKLGSES